MSRYPAYRPRRLRRSEALRRMVRETRVTVEQLILPLFVVPGSGVEKPIDVACRASRSSRSIAPPRSAAGWRTSAFPP